MPPHAKPIETTFDHCDPASIPVGKLFTSKSWKTSPHQAILIKPILRAQLETVRTKQQRNDRVTPGRDGHRLTIKKASSFLPLAVSEAQSIASHSRSVTCLTTPSMAMNTSFGYG